MSQPHRVGVISDTHGLVRSQALEALAGSELVIHAGDIGKPEILDPLRKIAPVVAVRGNVDHGDWANTLPMSETVRIDQVKIHVVHKLDDLAIDPAPAGIAVVICGHSHRPSVRRENGVLYFNPGSAGPRRFHLLPSVGVLLVDGARVEAQVIELTSSRA